MKAGFLILVSLYFREFFLYMFFLYFACLHQIDNGLSYGKLMLGDHRLAYSNN